MKARLATLLMVGLFAAVVGCQTPVAKTPTGETRTGGTKGGKVKSPAPSKSPAPGGSPGATTIPGSGASSTPAPSASPASASPSPSPTASMSASPAPTATASASASPASAEAPLTASVIISTMAFQPSEVTVKVGGSVTFTNRDTAPHSVQPEGHSAFSDSGILAAPVAPAPDGGVFTAQFSTAGEFKYFCGLHPSMTGTVVVVP